MSGGFLIREQGNPRRQEGSEGETWYQEGATFIPALTSCPDRAQTGPESRAARGCHPPNTWFSVHTPPVAGPLQPRRAQSGARGHALHGKSARA